MFDKIVAWFNGDNANPEVSGTNGDSLRAFVENVYKFLAELLSFFGEWPIDFE